VTKTWAVGELAEQAGVSVRTLHHYDEIGLLTPTRSAAGHRRYTESDLARLTQIVALRSVGLSLGEIERCLDSGEAPPRDGYRRCGARDQGMRAGRAA